MSRIQFNNGSNVFISTLRSRTEEYFLTEKRKKTGDFRLYSKTIILLSATAAIYFVFLFVSLPVWLSIPMCILLGVIMASIGFNIMHDGAHGSYSSKAWVNKLMAHALNIMGGNAFLWNQKHNINHHSFTNVEGMDDDIDIRPFLRLHVSQKRFWFHRFQHVYSVFMYGLTWFFWVYFRDFKKYFTRKISIHTPLKKMTLQDHFTFWISKVLHVSIFLVIPGFVIGWVPTIIGYSIMAFVCGLILAIVFQLAHIVEESDFVDTSEGNASIDAEWAVHQINTTANFATRSKFLNWLLGGLNFQVEHHLFPRVSHIHYPAISKIVKNTCKEFNVRYREYPTFFGAFRSHILYLRNVGIAK